jgi:glycosyltransferase involved in cell wall biosynthesis
MVREANAANHWSFLVAGIQSNAPAPDCGLPPTQCRLVEFSGRDIAFPIVGMSDVMPYDSRTFGSLSATELMEYENAFSQVLRDAFQRTRPDVIHAHHLWILTALARELFPRTPIVVSCHGSDLRQFQLCPHLQERVLRGCRGVAAVMALTAAQKTDITRLYGMSPQHVRVAGAGYDSTLFKAGVKPDPTPVRLVYAGKLSRAKGVPNLLAALERIAVLPWELHLVGGGGGQEGAACLGRARELGDRVRVHGPKTQAELAALMNQSHVLVLPSLYEGLALVILEAIASGCRIVATDLPGVGEVLGSERPSFVDLVAPPRLHSVDVPYAEDAEKFEEALAAALRAQIVAARDQPNIDITPLNDRLSAFTWPSVFARVQQAYFSVAGR